MTEIDDLASDQKFKMTDLSVVHEVEHHLHVGGRRVDPDPDAVYGREVVGEEVQHELVHLERTRNCRLTVKYLVFVVYS